MNYQQKIDELLNTPNLPHKLKVRFALYCAEDVRHLLTDERSIKALDITKLWLEGKASQKEIEDASSYTTGSNATGSSSPFSATTTSSKASSSYAASSYAASAAAYAASTAFSASSASNASFSASSSYAASYAASSALKNKQKYEKIYYNKLLEMINNLTELEKAIWDIK